MSATVAYTHGFEVGSKDISTTDLRQTVLMIAGARLRALAPDRFEKLLPLFAPWDLAGPLTVKATLVGTPAAIVLHQHPGGAPEVVGGVEGARLLEVEHAVELGLENLDARGALADLDPECALAGDGFEFAKRYPH